MMNFMREALQNYQTMNKGALPGYIFIYRDGVGGPSMYNKVLDIEMG
jgi:hypothetical protein